MNGSHLRGIGFALASFTAWVLADACMKLAGEASIPPYETIAFYGFFGASLMLARGVVRGEVKLLRPFNPRAQLVRALLALASNLANVVALKHLPLTTFYVSVFTAPMVISVGAAIFLNERLTWPKGLAVVIGFSGVVIALEPGGAGNAREWVGYAAAVATVACYSASTLWLRLMTRQEATDSVTFFAACVEMGFGFAAMIVSGFEPLSPRLLLILFAMGSLGTLGTLFNCIALKYTTAANVAQFHYTQIVAGALFGYFIWHEVPAPRLWLGAAVISAAGVFIAARARPSQPPAPVTLSG